MPLVGDWYLNDEHEAVWRPMLIRWAKGLDAYEKHGQPSSNQREVGYWNHERSNVGFLHAAAWLNRGIGILEYSHQCSPTGSGVVDFWFKLPNLPSYACEAKQKNIREPSDLLAESKKLLRATAGQLHVLLEPDSFERAAGLAFLIPVGTDSMDPWIRDWKKACGKPAVAAAIYECIGDAPIPIDGKHPHPGIMIFVGSVSDE